MMSVSSSELTRCIVSTSMGWWLDGHCECVLIIRPD